MDLIIQELHRNFFTEEQIDLLKNKTVERLQAPKPVVEALKKELQNFRFPIWRNLNLTISTPYYGYAHYFTIPEGKILIRNRKTGLVFCQK